MQQKRQLDYIMPRVRQQILGAVLLDPRPCWYLAQLSEHLKLHHATLQRELSTLIRAGILRTWRDGNRSYFAADQNCPILPELRVILAKTTGIADRLRESLCDLQSNIDAAFVYGSIATGKETSASDIDLMVIGDVALADLADKLRQVERDLGRNVNPSVYTRCEFRDRIAVGSHFLSSVMAAATDKLYIFGDENDLARLTESGIC